MRAVRLFGPGRPLHVERVPVPRVASGEALVRVRAAGVCHTELHQLDGTLNLGVAPLTPGHEVVGEVVERRGSGPEVGARVLVYPYATCGTCRWCRADHENVCPNVSRQLGFTADGGYAEYLVAPVRSLVRLSEGLADEHAAQLGCAAATAFHAAHGVARVEAGETVAVHGVGAVGFALVQLCRRAGARVVAIGRSGAKLRIAADLGADVCVPAAEEDAVHAVHEATGGEGADAVFDLVGTGATLEPSLRMLARRGRLVLCGYSDDRLGLAPLPLVLREATIRGAVGSTLPELRQVVDLATSGELRPVPSPVYALEEADAALSALRAGSLVGRAVLRPDRPASRETRPGRPEEAGATGPAQDGPRNPVSEPRPVPPATATPTSTAPPASPASPAVTASPAQLSPAVAGSPAAPAAPAGPTPEVRQATPRVLAPRPGPRPFEAELLELIGRGVEDPLPDAEFDSLALGLFAYQFEHNEPYRRFCEARGRTPGTVAHWTDLPAIPIGGFKEADLGCERDAPPAAVFRSSGTTGARRSEHGHPTLDVYDASAATNWAAHVLPDGVRLPLLVLNPPRDDLPDSSLAHYLSLMVERYGAAGSGHFVGPQGLESERLLDALRTFEAGGQPVALLGATFAFVHLLDRMGEAGVRLRLPEGSRVMDTGGVKGRTREVSRAEMEEAIADSLGVGPNRLVNMYGLTEHATQFLDGTLRRPDRRHVKEPPPWSRTRVLDRETLAPAPAGTVGLLCHTDLANRASVCTVLTEDLGVEREGGFELVGRAPGTEARGCSIAMDELLGALGSGR